MSEKIKLLGFALFVAVVSLPALGGLAGAEVTTAANESVTFDNSSNVSVEVTWQDSIADVSNASADVTFYNASEYADDPSTATVILTDSIAAQEGATISNEYQESDGLEDGAEYQVVVEADDTEYDSVSIEAVSNPIGGIIGDGSPGFGPVVAIAAIGVALMARLRAGGA